MGLTRERVAESAERPRADLVVALAGSPNVGKSTVFNALTGLHRHTGNWTGKTVSLAYGLVKTDEKRIALVDLPGSVSLFPESPEESVSADFLTSGEADAAILVCDALSLERNLIFVLHAAPRVGKCVMCLNMMDEARRAGIAIDAEKLSERLCMPVVLCSARSGEGMDELISAVVARAAENAPRSSSGSPEALPDPAALAALSREIVCECTSGAPAVSRLSRAADRVLTGRFSGAASMTLMFFFVFWLTAVGANAPSEALSALFGRAEEALFAALSAIKLPEAVVSCAVEGVFRTASWVTAVMLPPMAIFFPLFTLIEDSGLFPRIAFDLDRSFSRCGSCGRHAITSVMGLGCNAVGVCGCRIISSPRRRRCAILTNAFVPCNGRIGAIFLVISTFLASSPLAKGAAATAVFAFALAATFAASSILSRGKSDDDPFILEMVRFRRPQIAKTLARSFFDRTLLVLGRALRVAAPAGLMIWLASNIVVGDATLARHIVRALDPVGRFLGLDGVILAAFVFGFPANEIILPAAAMLYSGGGALSHTLPVGEALAGAGWNAFTAAGVLALIVLHSPCAATLLTIRRETGSAKTTALAFFLPSAFGVAACLVIRGVGLLASAF